MVEQLPYSAREEVLAVLDQAFHNHPMFPADTPMEVTRQFTRLMLETFWVEGHAYLHGIRHDGRLACVAFTGDAQHEPGLWPMVRFFWRALMVFGPKEMWDMVRGFGARPKYDRPYLELQMLGTLPDAQGQGHGRAMLRHLEAFAVAQGFEGIILATGNETPAYGFYVKEGYTVDACLPTSGMQLCHLRKMLPPAAQSSRGDGIPGSQRL